MPGNTANSIWSSPSTAWPATTVGLPGALTINAFAGALDTITLTVTQAADKTATAFVLMVHDASGTEISDYSAPLLSTSAPDGNGRQRVVFGTDTSRLGEIYRFKVGVSFGSARFGVALQLAGCNRPAGFGTGCKAHAQYHWCQLALLPLLCRWRPSMPSARATSPA